jgi:DnaJ-domain-containing protein 1
VAPPPSPPDTDFFALLDEPRRPWLDEAALKARCLAVLSAAHPDRFHRAAPPEKAAANQRIAALNEAARCLSHPKPRLRHLLELELGQKLNPIEAFGAEAMDFYLVIARACREADRFLEEKERVVSPLLKVQQFERAMTWSNQLSSLRRTLDQKRAVLLDELKALNPFWEAAPAIGSAQRQAALPLARLEQIYRSLGYLDRWSGQLQERLMRLTL